MAPPVRQRLIPRLTPDQHSQAAEALASVVERLAQYRSTGDRERLDSALDELRLLRDMVNAWAWDKAVPPDTTHFCMGCSRYFTGDECPRCGSVCP